MIPVASAIGFSASQTITIGSGADSETAVIASTTGGRGGRGGASITISAPLKLTHAAGAPVSGSGITLVNALTQAHTSGAQVATSLPTPGAPNKYYRRSQ
jgi:non-reducing end alpha-L-arabinofuranosidase